MKDEYDFSGGQRGKFYRPGVRFNLPVYLDEDLLERLLERARNEGVELGQLVNDLLRRGVGGEAAAK